MTVLLLVAGMALLIVGGILVVDGASNIARRHGISPAVIGLTLVAFGTSLPELAVNLSALSNGSTALAMGNILGSNIANMGLVLGAAVMIRSFDVESTIMRREIPLLLLVAGILLVIANDRALKATGLMLDRSDALVLLLLLMIFIYINATEIICGEPDDVLLQQASQRTNLLFGKRDYLFIVVGVVGLWYGGQLTVDSAMSLALTLGVSEAVIGLAVVAVGTSLPELVTSITAALRREGSLALGNVVGSNLINTLFILPVTAIVQPLPIMNASLLDIWASTTFTAVVAIFAFSKNLRLSRWEGAVLLIGYLAYISWRYTAF